MGEVVAPEYPFGNSNTRYVLSIQWSIRRLLHPYSPGRINALGISNNTPFWHFSIGQSVFRYVVSRSELKNPDKSREEYRGCTKSVTDSRHNGFSIVWQE